MEETPQLISLADDARAVTGIRRWKALGGLSAFAVAGIAAYGNGDTLFAAGTRSLEAGIAGYFIAWVVAVTIWRKIMQAETNRYVEKLREDNAAREAQARLEAQSLDA
jgi:hypothetical protein